MWSGAGGPPVFFCYHRQAITKVEVGRGLAAPRSNLSLPARQDA